MLQPRALSIQQGLFISGDNDLAPCPSPGPSAATTPYHRTVHRTITKITWQARLSCIEGLRVWWGRGGVNVGDTFRVPHSNQEKGIQVCDCDCV